MPVPSTINDIYTVAGSNPPGGGETPAEGDNHLRAAYSFIAALRDILNGTSSTTAAVQTLVVSGASAFNGGVTIGNASGDALTINSSAPSWPNGATHSGGAHTFAELITAAKGMNVGNTASATATTLDWYQEASFTPVAIGATSAGTGTYSAQTGYYTRIGNRVFFDMFLAWSAHTGSGVLRIGGLPFAAARNTVSIHATPDITSLAFDAWTCNLSSGNTYFTLDGRNQNTGANAQRSVEASDSWRIQGFYEV